MKPAIAYSTKDQVELTRRTFPAFTGFKHATTCRPGFTVFWADGSSTEEGRALYGEYASNFPLEGLRYYSGIKGGADAAIAWKLSTLLSAPENYTHIGLLENDVLLDPDWLEPTLALFEKGERDGLSVGAVSPRSYVDRVLIQRDGYAVCHNLGAGCIIFTRQGAEIALHTFRTHWWPDNVKLFAQLSGIDLRTYAAFRGNEQWVTTDWGWEAQLARHGLASLACTPAKCVMIGQNPPLAVQGLELTTGPVEARRDEAAFEKFKANTLLLRAGTIYDFKPIFSIDIPAMLCRQGTETLIFPHQLGAISATWRGDLELIWSQGFGPFVYRAGLEGASLAVHVSGTCSFLLTGGDAGAHVKLTDTRSGFNFAPELPALMESPASINVPGSPIPRLVTLEMGEGAVLYGLSCADSQMINTAWKFDWSQLPEAR